MMIVAMFGFAGLVFADSGTPVKHIGPGAKITKELAPADLDAASPSGDNTPQASPNFPSAVPTLPVAGDTCATAIPLTLNLTTKATTLGGAGVYCEFDNARPCAVDADCAETLVLPDAGGCVKYAPAGNDYQTPATAACYAGIGQTPTTAPGRDIVFSFTAPADGVYTIEVIQQSPLDAIRNQNEVLYITDCANTGTVNCIKGVNRPQSAAFISSTGASNNQSEALDCIPMTAGQTTYVVFDDGAPGKCSDNLHNCFADSDCAPGAACNPLLNAGGKMSLEVRPCNAEVEPNDTPAQATPLVCGMIAESSVGVAARCYLGTRAGAVCTRSGFLDQSLPNSNMRCSISGAQCVVDATGAGNCPVGELCQQQTDLDCDPRCEGGLPTNPNLGKTCTTQAFCNPGSDQGSTCGGTCQIESTCIVTATNANTGVACTPVCVGGLAAGRYCSSLSGCPGGGVCTTTPAVGSPGATCGVGEACSRIYNEGDADFYSLGVVPAGSAIFAGVDAKASNDYDFRLRITNDTSTIQFDDDDITSRGGANAPTIAGAVGDGTPAYVKVSRTTPRTSATYELYAHVRPPVATAQLEDESGPTGNDNYYLWPGDLLTCNPVSNGGYVRGTFAYNQDTDCFKFLVNKGDLMDWFGAGNPQRTPGATSLTDIPQPIVYDAEPAGISNFGFGANPRKNTTANVQQPSLNALSPAITSSYFQWRASYTGMLEVCYFAASQFLSQGIPAYPNNWSGSMTVNCGPVQNAGPGTTTADVSVTKTGPAGPVTTGDFIDYTITVTNNGTEIAQEVALIDTLDANLTFIGLTVDDTFGGNNVACFSLPTAGANDAPIYCINASMAPGSTTVYVLSVQVNNCLGDGVTIPNLAEIVSVSTDPNPSNDSATHTFTTVAAANNGCTDIVCSSGICIPELCTANDQCDAGGVCVSGAAPNCDDNSLCTDDSCSSAVGCVNDSSQAGDLCEDFNACTTNACDPLLFCVFPAAPMGTACDDGLVCTVTDSCDGAGTCGGASVCNDNNACTDDFADELNACACSYAPTVAGSACSDNNVCTSATPDLCDGAGVCVSGQPIVCDDGDACTGVETCDPFTGCVPGTPVVCAPPDQCHIAGVCDPGTGLCGYGQLPNGTVCDDGNPESTGDVCIGGVCTGETCNAQPAPKSAGHYRQLCKKGIPKPHGGDALTDADALCVAELTTAFAGITTATEICAVFDNGGGHSPDGPDCQECNKGEWELMGLALNICRERVCENQAIDSACGSGHDSHNRVATTVAASLAAADAIMSDPARTKALCKDAICLAKEINNGKGIHQVSLTVAKGIGDTTRLTWQNPIMDDGSGEASMYTIWRRALTADAVFVKLTDTTALTYVDTTAGALNWEYDITFTLQP